MTFARRAAGLGIVLVVSGCGAAPVAETDTAPDDVTFRGQTVRGYDRTMPDVDAIGYDLDLRVDEREAGRETYRATLTATLVATRALREVALDLEGNTVEAVEVDRRAATFTHDGRVLRVALPRALGAGRSTRVTVRYGGALFQGDGTDPNDLAAFGGLMVFQRNRAGRRIYASLNWPSKARRWLPVRDHPRDGAMVAMRLTFPARYTVLANGTETAREDGADGARTWQFVALTPMPTYDFHLAAYDGWVDVAAAGAPASGADARFLAYAADAPQARAMFADVPAAMDYFEDTFGAFRWGGVTFLEEPIFGGGMEHATVVSMDETLFRDGRAARTTAFHELAHHWSGNLVRIRAWNDFWLSEGVTDYLTRRFVAAHDGAAAGAALWRETLARALAADDTAGHALRPRPQAGGGGDAEVDVLSIFDDIPYKKGAFVLRMLEREVGEDVLTAFLRGWFERHRFAAVGTADLERELGARAGRDLGPFFAQWVYGEHHPVVRVATRYDAAAGAVDVTVTQTQPHGPAEGFAFPLDVELSRGAARARATIAVRGRATTARVPAAFEPTAVSVDPDARTLVAAACAPSSPACRDGYACVRGACLPR